MLNWNASLSETTARWAVEPSAKLLAPLAFRHLVCRGGSLPAAPPAKTKLLHFIGGGHGAGKSVIKERVIGDFEQSGIRRETIAVFGSDMFSGVFKSRLTMGTRETFVSFCKKVAKGGGGITHKVFGAVFEETVAYALQLGAPVIIDYHMDDPRLVRRTLSVAWKQGYQCGFVAPYVSMETLERRLEQRRQQTGRPYDLPKALQSHRNFSRHLPEYLGVFHTGAIVNNDIDGMHGSPPAMVVSNKGTVKIHDATGFEKILGWADASIPNTVNREQVRQPKAQDGLLAAAL